MGISVGLYFRLVKALAVVFMLMSLIAVPCMLVCHSGGTFVPPPIHALSLARRNL